MSSTNPAILIGWEVYVEKLGIGQIIAYHKMRFFSTKYEIEVMDDTNLILMKSIILDNKQMQKKKYLADRRGSRRRPPPKWTCTPQPRANLNFF